MCTMLLPEPQVPRSQIHIQVVKAMNGHEDRFQSSKPIRLSIKGGIDHHINIPKYPRQEVSTREIYSLHGNTLGKGTILIPTDVKAIKVALMNEHCPEEYNHAANDYHVDQNR